MHHLPSLTVQETNECRPTSGSSNNSMPGDKASSSRTSRSSSPTTAESRFNNLSQQLSTPSNGNIYTALYLDAFLNFSQILADLNI